MLPAIASFLAPKILGKFKKPTKGPGSDGYAATHGSPPALPAMAPPAPAPAAHSLPINIGGGVGITFGNSPMGIPVWAIAAGAVLVLWLMLRK